MGERLKVIWHALIGDAEPVIEEMRARQNDMERRLLRIEGHIGLTVTMEVVAESFDG